MSTNNNITFSYIAMAKVFVFFYWLSYESDISAFDFIICLCIEKRIAYKLTWVTKYR